MSLRKISAVIVKIKPKVQLPFNLLKEKAHSKLKVRFVIHQGHILLNIFEGAILAENW